MIIGEKEMLAKDATDSDRHTEAGVGSPASAPSADGSAPPPRKRALGWFGRCFYACGDKGLPPEITCLGIRYVLERVLKHDFHAATGLYRRQEFQVPSGKLEEGFTLDTSNFKLPERLICKINRRMHFCYLPLSWIGRLMTHSEVCNLRRCEGIPEVPHVLARIDSHTYVYEYIEGRSLNEKPPLPADFFDRLVAGLQQVHARHLVHFDLNKRGNILVDTEGRPHIIDFQISQYIGDRLLLSRRLSARLRRWLQSYDLYHIYKHKRRLQPERLTAAEEKLSYNHTAAMEFHRAFAKHYKRVRRASLRYLYAKGILAGTQDDGHCAETNPVRWTGGAAAETKGAVRRP
jgi:hypothetical protein